MQERVDAHNALVTGQTASMEETPEDERRISMRPTLGRGTLGLSGSF
jgi:hypothetical protein